MFCVIVFPTLSTIFPSIPGNLPSSTLAGNRRISASFFYVTRKKLSAYWRNICLFSFRCSREIFRNFNKWVFKKLSCFSVAQLGIEPKIDCYKSKALNTSLAGSCLKGRGDLKWTYEFSSNEGVCVRLDKFCVPKARKLKHPDISSLSDKDWSF